MVRDSNKDVGSIILLHVLAVMSSYEIELFVERSLSGKITKVQADRPRTEIEQNDTSDN